MALVASVNGKDVFSDKEMTKIVNTRVEFTDGSWCDVSTGEVHNAGSGYISIGSEDSSGASQLTTKGPEQVSASALELRGVAADAWVQVHDSTDLEYTITGPSDQVEALQVDVWDDTLTIHSDEKARSGGTTIIQSGAGHTVISGGGGGSVSISDVSIRSSGSGRTDISIGASSGDRDVQVVVKVPKGTTVNINRVMGSVVIDDIDGPLTAAVRGGDIDTGRVTDAQLTVQGSGDITLKEANGTVVAAVQGSGDIWVQEGSIPSLTATVQGSGDIKVGGSADTASLTVMGSGDISVEHIKQRPAKSIMGSGDIRVQRVG